MLTPTERLPELSEIVHPIITGSDMAQLVEGNLVSFISWKLLNWARWIVPWQQQKGVIGDPRLLAATSRCGDLWGLQS